MPYQEGQTTTDGQYTFRNGGWYKTAGGTPPATQEPTAKPAAGATPSTWQDIKNIAGPSAKAGALAAVTSIPTMVDLGVQGVNKATAGTFLGAPDLTPEQRAKVFSPEGLGHVFPKYLGEKIGRPIQGFVQQLADPTRPTPGSYADMADRFGVEDPEAKTPGGRLAQTAIEAAPQMIGGGPGLIRKGVTWAGSTLGDWAANEASGGNPLARMAGALLGGHGTQLARKGVTPNPREGTPRWNDVQDVTQDVNLSAGDRVGGLTQRLENWAGRPNQFSPDTMSEQATQGAMRRVGATTPGTLATRGGINEAQQNIQGRIDQLTPPHVTGYPSPEYRATSATLGSGRTGTLDPQLQARLDQARAQSTHPYPPGSPAAGPPNAVDTAIANLTSPGGTPVFSIGGANYQNLREDIERQAARAPNSRVRQGLNTVRDAMDDAMERSLSGGPHEGAWPQVRGQQQGLSAIQDIQQSGGAPVGSLNMRQLQTMAGGSPVGDYAERFNRLTRRVPGVDSPWAPELGGALLGAAANYFGPQQSDWTGSPILGAIIGGGLARGAKAGMRAPLYSQGVQSWLANQRWQPGPWTTPNERTMAKILAGQQGIQNYEDTPTQ